MYYIITKVNCTHCDRAKAMLRERGEEYHSYAYDVHPLSTRLMAKAGLKTVPQIWHNKLYIGGADELEKYLGEKND